MIGPTDKQNQPLALEPSKRGRGRPATGAAMTPAEKQKAYRERQKKEAAADVDGQIKLLSHLLEQAREDNQRLAGKVLELRKDNDDLIKVLDEASKEKKYWIDRALKSDKKKRHRDEPAAELERETPSPKVPRLAAVDDGQALAS